ncbi:hypothetical protein BKP35_12275 [Anaerobacillus arseniciselenatis]|uniref:Uncharacterized protein n=1 Tax=Anaerobacillus arseniciselenatis TaxID=85682 RepID=A0A1S2LGK7_9BACI|nr:hypothetical protein [Anaerobacillus arseniciselenatis]OIJ11511.1 hypothetical protein BKP35_12275 [Anaerobacillus arseniciselenatis]
MRKYISTLICFTLLFAFVIYPFNTAEASKKESENVINSEYPVFDFENGDEIGITYITLKVKTDKVKKGEHKGKTIFTITNETITTYFDGTESVIRETVDEIIQLNNDEALVNDELVDLNAPIATIEQMNMPSIMGGVSYLTSYSDNSVNKLTTMTSYERVKSFWSEEICIFLDPGCGGGSKLSKNAYTSGWQSNNIKWFKSYADQVASARSTINYNVPLLMAALGLTVLTLGSVLGALGSGIAAASFAANIYGAYQDGSSAVSNAYTTLKDDIVNEGSTSPR